MQKEKTLHLNLQKKWFQEIQKGYKTIEYREAKEYWHKRLNKKYSFVNFRNGYSKDAPSMTFNIIKIEKDKTPHNLKYIINTEFCYKIYLGSMLKNVVT